MDNTKQYKPGIGDEVFAVGQNGKFVVIAIHANPQTADLKLIGTDFRINVPQGMLTPSKRGTREDFSQAAARIVSEATEKD